MYFNLNDIKYSIENTIGGNNYRMFFQDLSNKHSRKNKTFNFLNTNRKCVSYLLNYYGIDDIDMSSLYECVRNDPDIQNTQSYLHSQLTSIINGTRGEGEKNEDLVVKCLSKNPYVKEIIKTSGEGSYIDMIQKIDLIIVLTNGKKHFVQVKPEGERITNWDKNSSADIYAFVNKHNEVKFEYKGAHNG